MSTLAFTVCFACWVINAVLATYLVSTGTFSFDQGQLGWLLALPILTGALSRVPLGIMTDKYGGRTVFTVVMLAVSAAMFMLSFADSYSDFLWASLAFGLAGGSFAVGVGYVSVWFEKKRQGTALGIFGMGNAGAAATTMLAPSLLVMFTDGGAVAEGWRMLPKAYAALMVVMALAFFLLTKHRVAPQSQSKPKTLGQRLKPLKNIVVWRFGLYYFLVFGSFVALAQWIVPYSVNVYQMSVAQAGLLAAAFSLPSGVIRAAGGWLSDKFGARTVMRWVFLSCIVACAILSIPKMNINSPGEGVTAKAGGTVTEVSETSIAVGDKVYDLIPPPAEIPADIDPGTMVLPSVTSWQEPAVTAGATVQKKQLLARGVTNIYYPSNMWIFALLIIVFGVATGVGKAGVYKFIPDQFPNDVGAVGGMVGLLGALGGFFFPPVFGYLLEAMGLWSSCWIVLMAISVICLFWMERVARKIEHEEAPELSELMERRPSLNLGEPVLMTSGKEAKTVEMLLQGLPFFGNLTPEQLKQVARLGRMQSVEASTVVFEEHDPGDTLYVILEGGVRVYNTGAGSEVELARFKAGDFFGELALIDGRPRSAAVATLAPCRFFLLGRTDFLNLLSKSPWMLSDVLVGLSTRLRETSEKMSNDRRKLSEKGTLPPGPDRGSLARPDAPRDDADRQNRRDTIS